MHIIGTLFGIFFGIVLIGAILGLIGVLIWGATWAYIEFNKYIRKNMRSEPYRRN